MTRELNKIVIHCTATPTDWTAENLERYFYEKKGWQHPGYHIVLERDGTRKDLLPIEKIANGVRGHNQDSLHIAYIGGITESGNPVDNRTEAQRKELVQLVKNFLHTSPHLGVFGHRDLLEDPYVNEASADSMKACPCFDVNEWVKQNF